MPLCTTILDKWLYVCRRSTSKGLLAAFLCLPNGRCNDAIAHLARTVVFSQKHAIVNPRTTVFLKNMRLSTPERAFFSKTCDCQPPNDCFSQKHAIVNPRTGRRNDVTTHIDPRIDCCKAQQLILPPESIVARRNRCLFEACDASNSIFALFAPLLAHNKLWSQSFKRHFYNLFILLLSLQKFLKEVYEERIQFSMLRGFISVVGLSFQEE